jgi:hypothetical protein
MKPTPFDDANCAAVMPGQSRLLKTDGQMLLTTMCRPLQNMMLSLRITSSQSNWCANGLKT